MILGFVIYCNGIHIGCIDAVSVLMGCTYDAVVLYMYLFNF